MADKEGGFFVAELHWLEMRSFADNQRRTRQEFVEFRYPMSARNCSYQ